MNEMEWIAANVLVREARETLDKAEKVRLSEKPRG